MKKEKVYTGYAIVSRDILDDEMYKKGRFGISLHDRNLDTCKRYCRGDQMVVKTYRVLLARFLELRWITKYPRFEKSHRLQSPRYIQLWHLRISWGKDYTDGYERDIVFQKEDGNEGK